MSLAAPTASLLAVAASGTVAASLSATRFLRVAQREHYVPGSVTRFSLRWWRSGAANRLLLGLAVVGALAAAPAGLSLAALAACGVVAAGPLGLSLRGRTSKLRWTRRLTFVAVAWSVLQLALIALFTLAAGATAHGQAGVRLPGATLIAACVIAVPALVDAALLITAPIERRLALGFVRTAQSRLRQVAPIVVAVTGSYGKTTTKGFIAHLLSSTRSVLASPASFNNMAGLARAVNENLAPGTEIFVAEMGTFHPGEIAELCSWVEPSIAVITAIGPVHLERFGSEERIAQAKAEITTRAATVVLNIDDERLARIADALAPTGKTVVRVSGSGPSPSPSPSSSPSPSPSSSPSPSPSSSPSPGAPADAPTARTSPDVAVFETTAGDRSVLSVTAGGVEMVQLDPGLGPPGNIACAVAVARTLGVPAQEIARLLPTLPVTPHRLATLRAGHGALVLDDTYNSNPAGARRALEVLRQAAAAERAGPDGDSPAPAPAAAAAGGAIAATPAPAPAPAAAAAGGAIAATPQRVVMVTPGMVELGSRQHAENVAMARNACSLVTDFIVVGQTNRRALLEGARLGEAGLAPTAQDPHDPGDTPRREGTDQRHCTVRTMANRDAASAWCREHLREGDVVLFENDLPDHYP